MFYLFLLLQFSKNEILVLGEGSLDQIDTRLTTTLMTEPNFVGKLKFSISNEHRDFSYPHPHFDSHLLATEGRKIQLSCHNENCCQFEQIQNSLSAFLLNSRHFEFQITSTQREFLDFLQKYFFI